MENWMKIAELPEDTKAALCKSYDVQEPILIKRIKYVRKLSAAEAVTFRKKNGDKLTASVMQTIYKLKGKLLPLKFNLAVGQAFEKEDALRCNYVLTDRDILAVVKYKPTISRDISYHNLKNIAEDEIDGELRKYMEAETRLGFNLTKGQLVRFSVFQTAEDEYAIIVTAVEAVALNYDFRKIFRAVMEIPEPSHLANVMEGFRSKAGILAGPIKEYWSKIFADLPAPAKLPYQQSQSKISRPKWEENYLVHVPRDICAELRTLTEDNKLMLMSFLQTAWGFLLQQSSAARDISFCLLVPQKKKSSDKSSLQSMVPVRLQGAGDVTVKDLVLNAFKQFVVSQPYASLGREDIMKLMERKGQSFDHYLNFYDFFAAQRPYAEAEGTQEGKIVSQKYMDVSDALLDLSFRSEANHVVLSAHYDNADFSQQEIRDLIKHYFLVLQQMLAKWSEPYAAFMDSLGKRWQLEGQTAQSESLSMPDVIRRILPKIPLFQECEGAVLDLLCNEGEMATVFEGDRVEEKEIESQLMFVVSGKVVRSIEAGDGWYNTLDILKEGSSINEHLLLPKRRIRISAEVLTEQAVILKVPVLSFNALLKQSPSLAVNFMRHALMQLEKYQRLWIQA